MNSSAYTYLAVFINLSGFRLTQQLPYTTGDGLQEYLSNYQHPCRLDLFSNSIVIYAHQSASYRNLDDLVMLSTFLLPKLHRAGRLVFDFTIDVPILNSTCHPVSHSHEIERKYLKNQTTSKLYSFILSLCPTNLHLDDIR